MAHGREAHDCKHVVATELLDLLLWHDLLWHYLLWHNLLWHYLLWTCCKSTTYYGNGPVVKRYLLWHYLLWTCCKSTTYYGITYHGTTYHGTTYYGTTYYGNGPVVRAHHRRGARSHCGLEGRVI
jgi:hypothetical protein